MIIGIDVGAKKCGIAVSNTEESVAFPKRTVLTAELLSFLGTALKEWQVRKVVVGESKNNKGEDNEVMKVVKDIEEKLSNEGVEVVRMPEMYTTAQALRHSSYEYKDEAAAALILQSYLDRERNAKGVVQ